jgi:hypothetical protein
VIKRFDIMDAVGSTAPRACTCHPDDHPPVPCARKYALQDCRRAHLTTETVTALTDLIENESYEILPWVRTCLRGIRQNVLHIANET